jgi:hypothetical protein
MEPVARTPQEDLTGSFNAETQRLHRGPRERKQRDGTKDEAESRVSNLDQTWPETSSHWRLPYLSSL